MIFDVKGDWLDYERGATLNQLSYVQTNSAFPESQLLIQITCIISAIHTMFPLTTGIQKGVLMEKSILFCTPFNKKAGSI